MMVSRVHTCQGLALGLHLRCTKGLSTRLKGQSSRFFAGLYRGTGNGTDRHRVRVGLRARAKVRLRLGVASGLRLEGGRGGSVPVPTPDSAGLCSR